MKIDLLIRSGADLTSVAKKISAIVYVHGNPVRVTAHGVLQSRNGRTVVCPETCPVAVVEFINATQFVIVDYDDENQWTIILRQQPNAVHLHFHYDDVPFVF